MPVEFTIQEWTTAEQREVCQLYWDQEVGKEIWAFHVMDIVETYRLPAGDVTLIAGENSVAWVSSDVCPECYQPREYVYSRSAYALRRSLVGLLKKSVLCDGCRIKREAQQTKYVAESPWRVRLMDDFDRARETWERDGKLLRDVSFVSLAYFMALWRVGSADDCLSILPRKQWREPLSPDDTFDGKILSHLWGHGFLVVHPYCPEDAFAHQDTTKTMRVFFQNTQWAIPVASLDDIQGQLRHVQAIDAALRGSDWPEAKDVGGQIAQHLCLDYLSSNMIAHGFTGEIGEKTGEIVRAGLERYSVGQMYNFIWRSTKDAAAFYLRAATCKKHAENVVPGSIQRMMDRAESERWDVKPFHRDREILAGMIETVVFDVVMKVGASWFETMTFPNASVKPQESENENSEQSDGDRVKSSSE